MTDEQIIKALECSPLNDIGGCRKKDALDLINRQKAEIERLNIRKKALTDITKNYDWKFAKAKTEAIKEFAERLKATDMSDLVGEQYINGEIYGYFHSNGFEIKVDNLAKEMTEQSVNYGSSKTEGK